MRSGLSAGTGKLCIFGNLGLVCLLSFTFLLFYVSLRNLCSGTHTRNHQIADWQIMGLQTVRCNRDAPLRIYFAINKFFSCLLLPLAFMFVDGRVGLR